MLSEKPVLARILHGDEEVAKQTGKNKVNWCHIEICLLITLLYQSYLEHLCSIPEEKGAHTSIRKRVF